MPQPSRCRPITVPLMPPTRRHSAGVSAALIRARRPAAWTAIVDPSPRPGRAAPAVSGWARPDGLSATFEVLQRSCNNSSRAGANKRRDTFRYHHREGKVSRLLFAPALDELLQLR